MNKEQQRFLAAVSAMTGLLSHTDRRNQGWKVLADASVDMADALLEKLDRTKPEADTSTFRDATVMFGTCPTAPKPEPFQSHE